MNTSTIRVLLAGLGFVCLTALLVVPPSLRAEPRAEADYDKVEPTAAYDFEEWGVWVVKRDGEREAFVDLAWQDELPSFVHRYNVAPPSPTSRLLEDPFSDPRAPQAEKPVGWFFPHDEEGEPFEVQVHLKVPGLQGCDVYPMPYLIGAEAEVGIQWRLRVGTDAAVPQVARVPGQRQHWWERLRQVDGAATVAYGEDAERFLFYDLRTNGEALFRATRDMQAYSFEFRRSTQHRPGPGVDVTELHNGKTIIEGRVASTTYLRVRLLEVLAEWGLRSDTAEALLDAWQPQLLAIEPGVRWSVISAASYEELLPLSLNPTPKKQVRVGLVLEYPQDFMPPLAPRRAR